MASAGEPVAQPAPTRVAVIDDQELFRRGLVMLLQAQDEIQVVGQAGDGDEATELAHHTQPDVILMDVHMPRQSGIDACLSIKGVLPSASILMLAVADDEGGLCDALKNGASGYVLKDASIDDVVEAIRRVANGQ